MIGTSSEIEAVELLNELISVCWNGERAFQGASEAVRQPALKRMLTMYAKQRRRFAQELQVEVVRLGGVLETQDRSPARDGVIARIDDEQAILSQLALAEDEAMAGYLKAEGMLLSTPLRAIVDRQTTAVLAARQRIHDAKRQFKKSA